MSTLIELFSVYSLLKRIRFSTNRSSKNYFQEFFFNRSSRTNPVSQWPPFGNFLRKYIKIFYHFHFSLTFFPAPARVVLPKFRPYGNIVYEWYGGSGQRRKASSPLPSLPLNTHVHTGPSMTGGDGGGSHFV
jgi:hypothetical protein